MVPYNCYTYAALLLWRAPMEPNDNLREQEAILRDGGSKSRLDELRMDLTGWLIAGGYDPDWSRCPRASAHYGDRVSQ